MLLSIVFVLVVHCCCCRCSCSTSPQATKPPSHHAGVDRYCNRWTRQEHRSIMLVRLQCSPCCPVFHGIPLYRYRYSYRYVTVAYSCCAAVCVPRTDVLVYRYSNPDPCVYYTSTHTCIGTGIGSQIRTRVRVPVPVMEVYVLGPPSSDPRRCLTCITRAATEDFPVLPGL